MKLRWRELLLALVMAVALWYSLTGSEKVESLVEVRIDYRGVPSGLIIRDGLIDKVSVRVRGSVGLLRSIRGNNFPISMDLSSLQKGVNTLVIQPDMFRFGGVEVVEVIPPSVRLDVDTVSEKKLPVEADVRGDLPADFVAQVKLTPDVVSVRGPTSLVEPMKNLRLAVPLANGTGPGVQDSRQPLVLPQGVDATPSDIAVQLRVGLKRKTISVTRAVSAHAPASVGLFIRPERVRITLSLPVSQAAGAGENEGIAASVVLPSSDLGSYSLPVHVRLPEDAELVKVEPGSVSVTVEQKHPGRR